MLQDPSYVPRTLRHDVVRPERLVKCTWYARCEVYEKSGTSGAKPPHDPARQAQSLVMLGTCAVML